MYVQDNGFVCFITAQYPQIIKSRLYCDTTEIDRTKLMLVGVYILVYNVKILYHIYINSFILWFLWSKVCFLSYWSMQAQSLPI